MTNAEKIKNMTNEQLCHFLWIWKINSITNFMEHGGQNNMNAFEIGEWLEMPTDKFVTNETYVSDLWAFDQNFNSIE